MENKVLSYRLENNMTQSELAKKAGLSLRTIQRIESGVAPKGFTLQSLAGAFGVKADSLKPSREKNIDLSRVKIINLSALSFLILPFGNIILPLILTYRVKNKTVRSFGKEIISLQIIWTIITSLLMIISPFLQDLVSLKIPIFVIVLIVLICLNVLLIFKNGISLTRNATLYITLRNSIL